MSDKEQQGGVKDQPLEESENIEPQQQEVSKLARLSEENLIKAVLVLAWPVVIEMLLQSSVGITAMAMVGRLSTEGIAAIGLSNQVFMLAMTIFAAMRTGATVLVARLVGAGDYEGAGKAARQALILSLLLSVALATLGIIFPEAGLRFLGANEEVVAAGVGYMRFKALSAIFAILVMTVTGILRGCGDTITSMWVNTLINIANVAFNWLFIFGRLGMPNMGVTGAGFAAMASRAIGSAIMIYVLFFGKRVVQLKRGDSNKLEWPIIKRILNIGIPAALEQTMLRGAQVFFTMILTGLGTNMYAAHQIAMRADSIAVMPGFGLSIAATTLVGQNLGAGQFRLARRAGILTIYLGIIIMSSMGVLLFIFAEQAMGFFTTEQEVIEAGAQVMRLMAFGMPFMAIARITAGALRGAGDTRYVMWGTGFTVWGARLGLAFILVNYFDMGLLGAWIGMFADHVVRSAFFFIRYQWSRWEHIKI